MKILEKIDDIINLITIAVLDLTFREKHSYLKKEQNHTETQMKNKDTYIWEF
jgi:hypothetical protein